MPPKSGRQRRPRTLGLLGIELPGSSDDEDYRPPGGSASAHATPPKRRRRRQQEAGEEDVPLAQRRRQLAASRSPPGAAPRAGAAGAAAGGAAAAAGAPAGPAIHLPEEVLCLILRHACAPAAGGAIPTAAAGARGGVMGCAGYPGLLTSPGWPCKRCRGAQRARTRRADALLRCNAAPGARAVVQRYHRPTTPPYPNHPPTHRPAAMCVSRAWRAAVEACPDVWTHIDLARGRRCRPSDAALARAAPRWRRLRSLSLAGVTSVGDAGLQVWSREVPGWSAVMWVPAFVELRGT